MLFHRCIQIQSSNKWGLIFPKFDMLLNIRKLEKLKMKTLDFLVHQQKKVVVPRSPEEIFQLENMAPATHSDLITNTYTLNVNTKFDGCCTDGCLISVPLTIIPVAQASYAFVEPPGY